MTPGPGTVSPETSFPEACRILGEKWIPQPPVLDKERSWVDIIAQIDLHAWRAKVESVSPFVFVLTYLLANVHVRRVRSSPPLTVSADHPLEQAARVIVQKEIGYLAASS